MAFELGLFSSFRFSSFDLIVSHLQYANDYHILTEASIENIWMVKYMHRSFTLASGLHVNFILRVISYVLIWTLIFWN